MAEVKDYMWNYSDPYAYLKKVDHGLSSMPPMIISVALTGSVHGKEANPNLPELPEEQAEQSYDAYKAGASIVHIHRRLRDNPSMSSYSGDDYLEVNALVREKCPDIIINNTSSGLPGITMEQRLACVEHGKPEMASLDLHAFILRLVIKAREAGQEPMSFDVCIPWTYGESEKYATKMKEKGVKPEMEIYDPGEFWFVDSLIKGGFVAPPYWIQFVMGFQTSMYATPANVLNLVQHLPPNSLFSMIGTGVNQMPMVTMGILLGGHIRVGMEDNIYIEPGKLCQSNAEQVEKVVRLARDMGRRIATPKEARQMLGISEKPTQYS